MITDWIFEFAAWLRQAFCRHEYKELYERFKIYCLHIDLINNVGKHYSNTGYGFPHGSCMSKTPGSFRGVSGVNIIEHMH